MKGVIMVVLAVLAMVQVQQADEVYTCLDIQNYLLACTSYMIGDAARPSLICCDHLKQVRDWGVTTKDKRDTCNCLKLAISTYQHIIDERLASMLGMCEVILSFSLSKNMDCNS
ncbi:hypothetical protein AQUCO_04100134v1 [Aquilegia coerulea]|uniref:Bifunctional inhibitor/plant lipid transfer protein/seed storage helical domain-containing protein n=1 Tax=Aquilegia coerulea TaxID=218851 RepID=A0A2G5CQF6_AQUCA|nr:hypothetical protein AQUCO_04100134v1 [Aquilegia coerulea]